MKPSKTNLFLAIFTTLVALQGLNAHAAEEAAKPADAAKPTIAKEPVATPADAVASPTPPAVVTPKSGEISETKTANVETSSRYGKQDRLLGDFLVGPYVSAVALPRPINFGGEAKWLDLIGISGEYGYLPKLTISGIGLKLTGYDFRFKIYPFRGAFFLGVGFGSQTFTGTKSQVIQGVTVNGTLVQNNAFVTPQIGWNWIWGSGFFMGLDLGVQLSSSRTSAFTSDAPQPVQATTNYTSFQNDITSKAETFGKLPFPMLTLLKVGYFF